MPKIFGRFSALEEVSFNFVGLFSECFFSIDFLWYYVGVIDF